MMRGTAWWVPGADRRARSGTLLSQRWVQAYVFELPRLSRSESEASLRYKVQATLPVNTDGLELRTHLFDYGKRHCGAAFIVSGESRGLLPASEKSLRIATPLCLARHSPPKVLLFAATPEGLASSYYETGILKTSFTPIRTEDRDLRERILARCPGAEIWALPLDPRFPLPEDLCAFRTPNELGKKLIKSFPSLSQPWSRAAPGAIAAVLLAAGLILTGLAMHDAWAARYQRNEAWRAWLRGREASQQAPAPGEEAAAWAKAQGAPVPALFAHLASDWGSGARIVDLQWSQGKLTVTAESPSALSSLERLSGDPWFKDLRIDDIRPNKEGGELFTVEGGTSDD